jgi:hypothetical protein
MACRAQYSPQYDNERCTEEDGYNSEELDPKPLQGAIKLYKKYMSSMVICKEEAADVDCFLREALSGATAQVKETF